MTQIAVAHGKIILSGEYAVVFGYPGIAVPATFGVEATWEYAEDAPMKIILKGLDEEEVYARKIVNACIQKGGPTTGILTIRNQIPVGRGMGSSTALVVAICKCLLGPERKEDALFIEDTVNQGHSGLDFAVIWANHPVKFKKGTKSEPVAINLDFLNRSTLIDTGKPKERTPELVTWVKARVDQPKISAALKTIGTCTERLLACENPLTVIPDHHLAQIALGVVTPEAQKIIAEIEKNGGAAKILGAGSMTGGGGMILAFH